MSRKQRIERSLTEQFSPNYLDVLDESGQHNVPVGAESHFKVTIVSSAFAGKMPVARHKLVYAALAAELESGLHALSIHGFTPEDWEVRQQKVAESPPCLGGSKHDKP